MFTKDTRTETFLTQMGVDFHYSNRVRYDNLEPDWRTVNLARPVPVREEAVVEYAALMEQHSPAPAPILAGRDNGKMVILDGVQRISAAELIGSTILSAYIVKTDSDDTESAIRVLANARLQGCAEPAEWTRRRAVEVLVVERGMTAKEVSRMGGWKPADIERLADIIRMGRAITSIGGPDLPDTVIATVGKNLSEPSHLEKTPQPIADFLHLIKAAKLSATDAEPFIERFFAPVRADGKVYAEYTKRLEAIRSEPEIDIRRHGRKSGPLPRDVVLMRYLKSAETVASEIVEEGDSVPYIDEFFRLLKSVDKHLRKIAPNKKPVKARVPADMWTKDAR